MNHELLRKFFFGFGWVIVFTLPVLLTAEIVLIQNLPAIQPWKWMVLFGAVVMIYMARNRDTAFKHHLV